MPVGELRGLGRRFFVEAKNDDISGLAAELTYRSFLALFPFVLFLAALGGVLASAFNVSNPAQEFLSLFGDRLPADARSVISGQVTDVVNDSNVGLLSIGIAGALWAAMGGAGAVIKAMNRAYDLPESRSFLNQKALALCITVLAVAAVMLAVGVLVSTQVFKEQIANRLGVGGAFAVAMQIVAVPVVLLAVASCAAVVYRLAPSVKMPMRNVTPGALIFACSWLVMTIGLSIYVANFGSYNATYGTLGGVVVLLFWFYLTNLLLLAGAEINALGFRAVRDTTIAEDLPAFDPVRQPHVLAGEHLRELDLPPPNRGGVMIGLVALLLTSVAVGRWVFRMESHQ